MEILSSLIENLFGKDQTSKRVFSKFLSQVKSPEPTWPTIAPSRLGIHPHLILAEGVDSIVCHSELEPEYVLKVYPHLDIDRLKRYQELVSKAGQILSTITHNPKVEVNPILGFEHWWDKDCWVGISKCVPGYNIKAVLSNDLSGDPIMRQTRKMMKDLGFSEDSITQDYANLSGVLNRSLGISGISIVPINVIASVEKDNLRFVITDLSGSIADVSSKSLLSS